MLALALVLVAAPAAKLHADELKRFEGEWRVVRVNNKPPGQHAAAGRITFKASSVTFPDRPVARFDVDPFRDPKWFTLHTPVFTERPIPFPGIYKFDGDRLVWLLVNGGGTDRRDANGLDPRPDTWDLTKLDRKHQVQLIELERVKK